MAAIAEFTGDVWVGEVALIPPGEGRSFSVAGQEIAVFRQRCGTLYATEARCPHRGAPLAEGVAGGGQVICPYHAYRFNLDTGECANDAACRIGVYPVREEGGWIVLTLSGAERQPQGSAA